MKKVILCLAVILISLFAYQVLQPLSKPVTVITPTPTVTTKPVSVLPPVQETSIPVQPDVPKETQSVQEMVAAMPDQSTIVIIEQDDLMLAATVQSEALPIIVEKPVYDKSIKPSNTKAYIPSQAFEYFDTIKKEQQRILPDFAYPFYFAGLIEHESCISLTHKKCWNPASKLDTKRELGIGIFQLTKAYKADGSIRFDTLSELRKRHMAELSELSWSNVVQRADLQIRAGILLSKGNWKALYTIPDDYERLAMTDAAYNGGLGSINKDRQYCGLKKDCNPDKWFGHVEVNSLKSRKPIYAGRSAFDISRHHAHDVLKMRMPKYKPFFTS